MPKAPGAKPSNAVERVKFVQKYSDGLMNSVRRDRDSCRSVSCTATVPRILHCPAANETVRRNDFGYAAWIVNDRLTIQCSFCLKPCPSKSYGRLICNPFTPAQKLIPCCQSCACDM